MMIIEPRALQDMFGQVISGKADVGAITALIGWLEYQRLIKMIKRPEEGDVNPLTHWGTFEVELLRPENALDEIKALMTEFGHKLDEVEKWDDNPLEVFAEREKGRVEMYLFSIDRPDPWN